MIKIRRGVSWVGEPWHGVRIGFVPNEKVWKRILKDMDRVNSVDYPTTNASATLFKNTNALKVNIALVTVCDSVDNLKDPVQIMSLIAHEATHCWDYITECIGETNGTIEIAPHMVQWLTALLGYAYRDARMIKALMYE